MKNRTTACGGCGETDPKKRCVGCLHDFGDPGSAWVNLPQAAAALTEAQATIARLEAALQGIADATDLYEPCGWAVHRARAALSPGKGE